MCWCKVLGRVGKMQGVKKKKSKIKKSKIKNQKRHKKIKIKIKIKILKKAHKRGHICLHCFSPLLAH